MKMLIAILALFGPTLAKADTFAFTGTVTSASGSFSAALGDTVTGTYFINYGAAIAEQSSGVPGTSSWVSTSDYFNGDFPTDGSGLLVFTSTAQVLGTSITYATELPDPGFNVGAFVQGSASGSTAIASLEQANQASGGSTQSFFEIGAPDPVFDASGAPLLTASAFGIGDFAIVKGGTNTDSISYSITSIQPASTVPLPASLWLMLSGLFGFAAIARKAIV